jgi:regulator of sirC expression with transglutaminase-like and TPR domain
MYRSLREWSRAIKDYDQVLSLRSKDAQALYNRGMAKRGIGDQRSAQDDIAAAVAIDPNIGM